MSEYTRPWHARINLGMIFSQNRLDFEEAWAALPPNVQRMLDHLRREWDVSVEVLPAAHRRVA
jgi:hypothetical protein